MYLHSAEILPYHLRQHDLHPNKSACILKESIVKHRLLVSGFFIIARRAGDYKMHSVRVCVCSCVIECVSRFYKGLYITLVVSPWPFQCFYDLIAYVLSFDAVISHLGPQLSE